MVGYFNISILFYSKPKKHPLEQQCRIMSVLSPILALQNVVTSLTIGAAFGSGAADWSSLQVGL